MYRSHLDELTRISISFDTINSKNIAPIFKKMNNGETTFTEREIQDLQLHLLKQSLLTTKLLDTLVKIHKTTIFGFMYSRFKK